MQIVDTHHHLWDLSANYYPWLIDRITPRVCGDYAAIRKNYLISDFIRDIGGEDIVKSVHVQAEHDPADPVRETRWLQSVAEMAGNPRGYPNAIVAYADLSAANAEAVLEDHCRSPNMRGIRQSLNGIITDPANHRDLLNDSAWRKNLTLLRRYQLSFDLQIYPSQMPDAADVIRRNEWVQFILCHAGLPLDRTATGVERWRFGMKRIAELPNSAVKVSGLGMFDHAWNTESIKPIVLDVIEIFGTDRVMFASNFPVDGMMGSYAGIWESFKEITKHFSSAEREDLFRGNALRLYRI